ncbi:hypothetical protein [Halochromatium glycolicum]|uniref:Uncharacterized protein n=1 Tax=Halochromatium glycolicum TaxID=85075 RepID=A0AAJ0U7B3_9GAMM|nr:hypothetical protein [Halochromatium glycolicum]MBK1706532.1 hypothetical protein [Halochromatium glycolicum]
MSHMPTQPGAPSAMTPAEVVAQALELIQDSVSRYEQLQSCFNAHNNEAAAELFGRIAAIGLATAAAVARLQPAEALPRIAPWDFLWRCPDVLAPRLDQSSPEDCHHPFAIAELIRLALQREHCALTRLQDAHQQAHIAASRAILARIVEQQQQQLTELDALLAAVTANEATPPDDLDPPNRPE